MPRLIDLTGRVIGRLTILSRAPENGRRGEPRWLVSCECGTKKEILGVSLRYGRTLSCGCISSERAKANLREIYQKKLVADSLAPTGTLAVRSAYAQYKHGRAAKKFGFELTIEQFFDLARRPCEYCSVPPTRLITAYRGADSGYFNGIDRLNSEQGYKLGNVVSCCTTCNRAKNVLSLQDWFYWVERLHDNLSDRLNLNRKSGK